MAPADAYPNLGTSIAGAVYAALGALIIRRARRNVIGWILLGVGYGFTVISVASAYAVLGILTHPGSLPGPELAGAVAQWTFVASIPALAFMLFFFPDGHVAIPPMAAGKLLVGVAATVLTVIGWMVKPQPVGVPAPGGATRFRIRGGSMLSRTSFRRCWWGRCGSSRSRSPLPSSRS